MIYDQASSGAGEGVSLRSKTPQQEKDVETRGSLKETQEKGRRGKKKKKVSSTCLLAYWIPISSTQLQLLGSLESEDALQKSNIHTLQDMKR